jgi:hypothetical protein
MSVYVYACVCTRARRPYPRFHPHPSILNPQFSTLYPLPSPVALGLVICLQDLLADLAGSHSFCEFNMEKRVPLKIEHLALYKDDLKPALSKEQQKIATKARSVRKAWNRSYHCYHLRHLPDTTAALAITNHLTPRRATPGTREHMAKKLDSIKSMVSMKDGYSSDLMRSRRIGAAFTAGHTKEIPIEAKGL